MNVAYSKNKSKFEWAFARVYMPGQECKKVQITKGIFHGDLCGYGDI